MMNEWICCTNWVARTYQGKHPYRLVDIEVTGLSSWTTDSVMSPWCVEWYTVVEWRLEELQAMMAPSTI